MTGIVEFYIVELESEVSLQSYSPFSTSPTKFDWLCPFYPISFTIRKYAPVIIAQQTNTIIRYFNPLVGKELFSLVFYWKWAYYLLTVELTDLGDCLESNPLLLLIFYGSV